MGRRILIGVLAAVSAMLLAVASIAGGAQPGVPFEAISDYDLTQLGFDLKPVPAAEKPAKILPEQASEIAAMHAFGQTPAEAKAAHPDPEVKRAYGRAFDDEELRTVWVVVYPGGEAEDVPWGPVGQDGTRDGPAWVPDYTGVMIDDQTGEVLVRFRGGAHDMKP
jgi:hypothetical protein